MAGKSKFVRETRLMNGTDNYNAMEHFDIRVPVYSASLIESLDLAHKDERAIKEAMSNQKPKNIVEIEAPKYDGFVSLFEALVKPTREYTNMAGVIVDVITIIGGNIARFEGKVVGIDGFKVALEIAGDNVVMCSVESEEAKTWFFN